MNRLETLLQWYQEDPTDPFNAYALALEYIGKDDAKAKYYFDLLLTEHPDYLPTYYHAAVLYAQIEDIEKTESLYQTGIQLALNQQNTKAYQELQRAYRQWKDELEEW